MRARLVLLAGQTVALGLTVAFLVVPASALFLHEYGADALPYAYLAVAVAGVAVSSGMRRAQGRMSLAGTAATVLVLYLGVVAAGWLLLELADAAFATFPLLVLFPLSIPVGFVLVGTQAGRLLDLREMKQHFPRVVGGFSVGFAVGGLLAAWLVHVIGGPVHLLGLDLVAGAVFLALVFETARRHPAELRSRPERADGAATTPVVRAASRRLSRNPLVMAVFGYQVLSAAVTQLLDYMVWERAAARYPDPTDLARFQGVYGAVINLVAIIFVALLAGRLLSRFGLALGLAANPGVVVVLLVAGTAIGYVGGAAGLLFLLVVCTQQVVDISLTDGMTRTSINTTYQALAPGDRVAAQTAVEAAGVPMALGLVGVVLLLFDALRLDVRAVGVLTLGLSVVWLVLAVRGYREYGTGLRRLVSARTWHPRPVADGEDAGEAVRRLLASDDPRDVEVGLSALTDLPDVPDGQPVDVLLDPSRPVQVRAAAARASAVLVAPREGPDVTDLLDDPEVEVRLAAAAAFVAQAGASGRLARTTWTTAVSAADRSTRAAALRAAAQSPDAFFVPHLLTIAADPDAPLEVAEALLTHVSLLAPALEALLVDPQGSRTARERLVAAFAGAGGRTGALRFDVDAALAVQSVRAGRARAVLGALPETADGGDDKRTEPLRRALGDELAAVAAESAVVLDLISGERGLARLTRWLDSDVAGRHAAAVEAIEVTAGRRLAPLALRLIDPASATHDDAAQLPGYPASTQAVDWLRDLIDDPHHVWQEPWLRACALYAAPALVGAAASELAVPWVDDADPVVAETARWVVSNLDASAHDSSPVGTSGPTERLPRR